MNNKDRMIAIALPERTLKCKMVALREAMSMYRLVLASRYCERVIPGATAISKKSYSTTTENGETYDVVIAGGGMIGMTLACAIG